MYWKLSVLEPTEAPAATRQTDTTDGRFVLHRHRDDHGPHLDLRLEQAGYCCGWRIDATELKDDVAATEKSPHPVAWLERDGAAERLDEGVYRWEQRKQGEGVLLLAGRHEVRHLAVARGPWLPPETVRAVHEVLRELALPAAEAAQLLRDGQTARERAMARFLGLGRELDGAGFDDALWRRTLRGCSLEEVQTHLHQYEVRFDEKYPPAPVSRPAPLEDEEDAGSGTSRAMAILADAP